MNGCAVHQRVLVGGRCQWLQSMTAEWNLTGYPVETYTRAVAIHVGNAETVAAANTLALMLVVNIQAQVLPQFAGQ